MLQCITHTELDSKWTQQYANGRWPFTWPAHKSCGNKMQPCDIKLYKVANALQSQHSMLTWPDALNHNLLPARTTNTYWHYVNAFRFYTTVQCALDASHGPESLRIKILYCANTVYIYIYFLFAWFVCSPQLVDQLRPTALLKLSPCLYVSPYDIRMYVYICTCELLNIYIYM